MHGDEKQNRSDGPAPEEADLDEFIRKLTESQGHLRAYILAALGNYDDAADVLQRTNLVLWRNARSFRPDAEFMPWAVTIAKYEILSFYRDRSRDRHVFSEDVTRLLLKAAWEELPDLSERRVALRQCIKELSPQSREMLRLRYDGGHSLAQIGQFLQRSENAIKCALVRIRKSLERCIERQLRTESA